MIIIMIIILKIITILAVQSIPGICVKIISYSSDDDDVEDR